MYRLRQMSVGSFTRISLSGDAVHCNQAAIELNRRVEPHTITQLERRAASDLKMPEVRQRLTRREAQDTVVDGATKQHTETIDRTARLHRQQRNKLA